MADLVVPQLGESITEAVVARWLKQVGEPVAADEPIAELETDKITVQLPSPVAGALAEQRAQVGATVKVGQVIGAVAPTTGMQPKSVSPVQKPNPATPQPTPAMTAMPIAQPQPAAAAQAAPPAPKPAAPAAPAPTNGQPGLDRDALMRLTPSQRVAAREAGSLPAVRAPSA